MPKQTKLNKKQINEVIERCAYICHAILEQEEVALEEVEYLHSFVAIAAEVMQDTTAKKFNDAVSRVELKHCVRKVNE